MNFKSAYDRFSYRCLKLQARELVLYLVRFAYSERFHMNLYEEDPCRQKENREES